MHFTYTDKDILDGRFEFRQSGSFRVLSPYIILKIIAACVAEVFIALLVLGSFDDIVIADIYKSAISYIIIRIALSIILPILPIWYILFNYWRRGAIQIHGRQPHNAYCKQTSYLYFQIHGR